MRFWNITKSIFSSEKFNSMLGNASISSTSLYLLQWFAVFGFIPVFYGIYLVVFEFISGGGDWFGPELALILFFAFIGLLIITFLILFLLLIGLSWLYSLPIIFQNSKMSFSQVFEVLIFSLTPLFLGIFVSIVIRFFSYYISYLLYVLPYYFYFYFIQFFPFVLLLAGSIICFYLQYKAWRKVYSVPIKYFLFSQILFILTIFILFAIITYIVLNPYIFYMFF